MNDEIQKEIELLLQAKKLLQKYGISTKILDEKINDYFKNILEDKLC